MFSVARHFYYYYFFCVFQFSSPIATVKCVVCIERLTWMYCLPHGVVPSSHDERRVWWHVNWEATVDKDKQDCSGGETRLFSFISSRVNSPIHNYLLYNSASQRQSCWAYKAKWPVHASTRETQTAEFLLWLVGSGTHNEFISPTTKLPLWVLFVSFPITNRSRRHVEIVLDLIPILFQLNGSLNEFPRLSQKKLIMRWWKWEMRKWIRFLCILSCW